MLFTPLKLGSQCPHPGHNGHCCSMPQNLGPSCPHPGRNGRRCGRKN